MNTSSQILPGISAIYHLDCRNLIENIALRGICEMPVPVLTALNEVEIFDEAECSCKTQRDGASHQDTVSLKFLSNVLLPIHQALGFVVIDVNGKSYLIGAKEPPYPVVEVENRCGLPDGDGAGFYYEVKHIAIKSLIQCTISV
jgi:hypothetical protein